MKKILDWSEDKYWKDALEDFYAFQDSGGDQINLDLNAIRNVVYNGDGPAYKLMEAMVSEWKTGGMEGHRGAPRILLALLMRLQELSKQPG